MKGGGRETEKGRDGEGESGERKCETVRELGRQGDREEKIEWGRWRGRGRERETERGRDGKRGRWRGRGRQRDAEREGWGRREGGGERE